MMADSRAFKWIVTLSVFGMVTPVYGGFDQWRISEIFSSADGTIQYIELATTAADQQDLNGVALAASNAAGQVQSTLQLGGNLSGSTANRNVLIATSAFATLTGLTPDYTISPGFLSTSGGTVNFANGVSVLSYQARQLPLNGIQSLGADLIAATATPTNFANGLVATLAAPVHASFDVASSILHLPLVNVPGVGIARLAFDVNLQSVEFTLRNDFFLYDSSIVAGDNAAQLLPGNILSVPALPIGDQLYAFRMAVVGDNPLRFGNLTDIVVTNNVPPPVPSPSPQPSALQQSIDRGRADYALNCATCHGDSGNGGIGPSLRATGLTVFEALRSRIDLTMPQNAPSACRDAGSSTCATDVANFILNVFQQGQVTGDEVDVPGY